MTTPSAASAPPGFLHRLETHVALAVTLVVAFALGAAMVIATRAVTNDSLERASRDVAAARLAFYRLEDDRAEFAAAQATLVTTLPVFRAYMTDSRLAGDHATMQVMADEYRQALKAAFCIVTGPSGAWTASSGWPDGVEAPDTIRRMIAGAAAGQSQHDIAGVGDQPFLVVSEPGRFAAETLGTLTVGYALDHAVARQLAEVTHSDVNIVVGNRLAASSLAGSARAALADLIVTDPSLVPGGALRMERLGDREYLAAAFTLSPNPGSATLGRLVLLQDWAPTRRDLDQLRRQLFTTGAAIFVVALAGGLLFAHRVSRPLKEIASAAGDIASGNWTRQVPVRGSVEALVMARAFNEMTTSLRHWYDEAKKRDDELRKSQKMEAIGRLAGGIAHDFNNLLAAMRGYAELVLLRIGPGDPQHDDVAEIVAAADRGAALTRQLLVFSGRQTIRPGVLALDQVVIGIERMLRSVLSDGIDLVMCFEPDVGHVHADPGQIEQVLVNLVINARDAMPNGGTLNIGLANVTLGSGSRNRAPAPVPGPYVRLSVADTGHGMDPQTAARIFEPFFTTKDAGRGTGLGLAIVYGIVQGAGGVIELDSAVGVGTTFRVYLPRTMAAAIGPASSPAPPASSAEPPARS